MASVLGVFGVGVRFERFDRGVGKKRGGEGSGVEGLES